MTLFCVNSFAQGRNDQRIYKRNMMTVKMTKYERKRTSYYGGRSYYDRENYRHAKYYGRTSHYRRVSGYGRSSYYDYEPDNNYDSDYDTDREYDSNNENDKTNAPFPSKISSTNMIKVHLGKLAWGAYDDEGNLVKWGKASGGKNYCADIKRGCKTITGTFTIYRKQGPECKSNRFPVGKGGAPMPYCMHFHNAYAMHGGQVPNYNASHGCVRLLRQDAQWLNEEFVRVGRTRVNITY